MMVRIETFCAKVQQAFGQNESTDGRKNRRLTILMSVVLSVLSVLSVSLPLKAQEKEDSLTLVVYFPTDVMHLELSFRDNYIALEQFVSEVSSIMSDPCVTIRDITVRSGASPEGSFDHNQELSRGRGRAVKDYLRRQLRLPDNTFCIDAVGEDWESLWRLVAENEDVPYRERVIDIFERHSDYIHSHSISAIGSPKKELRDLDGGRVWNWLLRNIYPELRGTGSGVVCHFTRSADRQAALSSVSGTGGHGVDTLVIVHEYHHYYKDTLYTGTVILPGNTGSVASGKPVRHHRDTAGRKHPRYRFALKTNLLFDLAAAPNVELEFPIGKRVSIMAEHTFPWYTFSNDRHAYQFLNSGAEARLWLGDRSRRSVLTGWYVGLYGSMTEFDFELNGKGRQFPYTWQTGLTAGWSMPLGKLDNWRLEFGLGVGYMPYTFDYYEQSPSSGLLVYKYSKDGTWIGPTKLKCSLVWMLPMNRKDKTDKKANRDRKSGKEGRR